MYEYVIERLQVAKGNWPRVAEESGVPLRTLEKIARREIRDPGVSHIERLADHFRERRAAPRRFCEHKGATMGEWIEGLVKRELRAAAEEAIVVAGLAPLLGIARDREGSTVVTRDRTGKPGKSGEGAG